MKTGRWVRRVSKGVMTGALVVLVLASGVGFAQDDEGDDMSSCEDTCYGAQDRCFDHCGDADDQDSCEDRCVEDLQTCLEACR